MIIVVFFCLATTAGYFYIRHLGESRSISYTQERLRELMELVQQADDNLRRDIEEDTVTALRATRAVAEMLEHAQQTDLSAEQLRHICNKLGLQSLAVTDNRGIITTALPVSDIGKPTCAAISAVSFRELLGTPGAEKSVSAPAVFPETAPRHLSAVCTSDGEHLIISGIRANNMTEHAIETRFSELLRHYRISRSGQVFLFRNGELMNRRELILSVTPGDLLALPKQKGSVLSTDENTYLAYSLEKGAFRLIALVPQQELRAHNLRQLNYIIIGNLLLFFILFIAVAVLLQRQVIRGLGEVTRSLRLITAGKQEERVNVGGCPEFIRLSTDINAMADGMRYYSDRQRAAMHRELKLAQEIQQAALPNKFPAFPNQDTFDIYASCEPAVAVGGTFYDYFLFGEDLLCFLVADIADVGIPAALYMMRCMTVIRSIARRIPSPAALVTEANRTLHSTNGTRLSLFYGCLDTQSGHLTFVNAGSLSPLLMHVGSDYRELPLPPAPLLCSGPDTVYTESEIDLRRGDRLFLFTQGLLNASGQGTGAFGKKRLLNTLNKHATGAAADLPHLITTSLKHHCDNRAPKEDITMLVLEYCGQKTAQGDITLPATERSILRIISPPLEEVFAAPNDIDSISATIHAILRPLAEGTRVSIHISCNAKEAALRLRYPAPLCNPIPQARGMDAEHLTYRSDTDSGNEITFTKKLS